MQAREQLAGADRGRRQGATVLVVDDDPAILETISIALERHGYMVLQAGSAELGLELCQSHAPDLLLLDMRLPGMSGLDLAAKIRESSEIPVVFLSAYSDCQMVRQAASEGAFGYLVKPIRFEQLGPAIESALARGSEMKALRERERGLSLALSGERAISIAVGMLIERGHLSSDEAFDALRRHARGAQRKLGDVAVELVKSSDLLHKLIRSGERSK
jgi:response regulator NasT